jgi:hypothetical protein
MTLFFPKLGAQAACAGASYCEKPGCGGCKPGLSQRSVLIAAASDVILGRSPNSAADSESTRDRIVCSCLQHFPQERPTATKPLCFA